MSIQQPDGKVFGGNKGLNRPLIFTPFCFPNNLRKLAIDYDDNKNFCGSPSQIYLWTQADGQS